MYKKSLEESPEFLAGDETLLREILHPHKDAVKIGYSIAHAKLEVGKSSLPHRLNGSEVYHILEGKGVIHIDAQSTPIQKGDTIYVPNESLQFVENSGESDLIFICIVEPAWTPESEFIDT